MTTPYGLAIADKGVEKACKDDRALRLGLNTYRGKCTHPAVAASLEYEYVDPQF